MKMSSLDDMIINPMSFSEECQSRGIFERLKEQREENRFCDLTLKVNGTQFNAHRAVLAACSPYFDSILKNHSTEREKLCITHSDAETFQNLLDYIYMGNILIHRKNVTELLRLSNHFMMASLKSYCIEYLDKCLETKSCLATRDLAEKYGFVEIVEKCKEFITTHIQEIIYEEEIPTVSFKKLEALISDKSLQISDVSLLHLISRWIFTDMESRQSEMKKLVAHVNFTEIDENVITEHIDREPLYNHSETALFAVLQSLVDSNILLPKYQTMYDILKERIAHNNSVEYSRSAIIEESESVCRKQSLVNTKGKFLSKRLRKRKQKLKKLNPKARLLALRRALLRTKAKHDETKLKCDLCAFSCVDSDEFEQHLWTEHSKGINYKCGECGFICQLKQEYLVHMTSHFPGPPFDCISCESSFDTISLLLAHRVGHQNQKTYTCDLCSFKTRYNSCLVDHRKCHEDVLYECQVCQRNFPSEETLEQHAITHETQYYCDVCGFGTKLLSILNTHKKTHEENSKNASGGLRPHTCGICGRGFLEKSHLVRHERIHLQDKPFKCDHCDYASSRRDKLKEHFARHHGENANAKVPYKARPLRSVPKKSEENNSSQQASDIDLMIEQGTSSTNLNTVSIYPGVYTTEAHLDFLHNGQIMLNTSNRQHQITAIDPRFHPTNSTSYHVTHVANIQTQAGSQQITGTTEYHLPLF